MTLFLDANVIIYLVEGAKEACLRLLLGGVAEGGVQRFGVQVVQMQGSAEEHSARTSGCVSEHRRR